MSIFTCFIEGPVQESHQIAYIHRPLQCNYVWGLKGVVQLTDPAKLKQFEWLVHDISPTKDRLQQDPNYSVRHRSDLNFPLSEFSVNYRK